MSAPNYATYAKLLKSFKARYAEKKCLAPSCLGGFPIISAHTLSKEAMLRPIARNGHVYTWRPDFYAKLGVDAIKPRLLGIGEVSTFNGFCSVHDKGLFSPIEDQQFVCAPEQMFLHAYRAIAKESYLKRKQFESFPSLDEIIEMLELDPGRPIAYSPFAELQLEGIMRGAEEIERTKVKMDSILSAKDFRRLVTHVLPYRSNSIMAVNSVFLPDFDFSGQQLQDLGDTSKDTNALTMSILPNKGGFGGFVLMSYLDNCSLGASQFISSLLAQPDLSTAIFWVVICYFENVAFSPSWWEAQSDSFQRAVIEGFHGTLEPAANLVTKLMEIPVSIDDLDFSSPFVI